MTSSRAGNRNGPALPDIVYVVGGPVVDNRSDLRHSLRTLAANFRTPFNAVWMVGDPPVWLRDVYTLPLDPDPDKFRNQRQSLTAYVNDPEASASFVLMNDDMFCVEPSELVTCRYQRPLSTWAKVHRAAVIVEGRHNWDCWHCSIIDTAEWVEARTGADPFLYEAHTPLLFDAAKLRDILADYPADRRFVVGETYPIAGMGGDGENRGNAKCKTPEAFDHKLGLPMPYLSGSPETWAGVVGEYIKPRFDKPSPWEEEA